MEDVYASSHLDLPSNLLLNNPFDAVHSEKIRISRMSICRIMDITSDILLEWLRQQERRRGYWGSRLRGFTWSTSFWPGRQLAGVTSLMALICSVTSHGCQHGQLNAE
jgi:hypothetical protein